MRTRARTREPLRRDGATSALIGIMVAVVVTSLAFTAAITLMGLSDGTAQVNADAAELKRLAQEGVRLIVEDTGQTTTGSPKWQNDADALQRFGLASGASRNFLDGEKIQKLRQAAMEGSANGYPDYDEVKDAFGFTSADFHLRIYPLVYGVDDPRFRPYKNLELAYIGESERATAPPAPTVTITPSQAPSPTGAVAVRFTIECTSGPAEDVYLFTTRLDTGNGNNGGSIARSTHSPVVTCGDPAPQVVFDVRWENLDWADGTTTYTLEYDVKSYVTDSALEIEKTFDVTLEQGAEQYTLTAESMDWNFVDPDTPSVLLDKRDRTGGRYKTDVPATVKVWAPGTTVDWDAGTAAETWTGTIPANQQVEVAFSTLTSQSGTWTLIARSDDGLAEARERFTFTSTGLTSGNRQLTADAEAEVDLFEQLTAAFDRAHYPSGDIFYDVKDDTLNKLAYPPHGEGVLDNYAIVIIGGNLNTQSLSGAFAEDLRKWVEDGGTLIVLGNEKRGSQWMQSANAFKIHYESASGSLFSPDPTHPLLHAPDELRYREYVNTGRTYRMTGGNLQGYDHVLVDSQTDEVSNDILSISDAGVYGKGTVLLTSLRPTALTDPQDNDESLKFLNNLMSRALDTLHLDYGPPVPDGAAVGSATRTAVVPHPREPELLVEVKVVLYTFK